MVIDLGTKTRLYEGLPNKQGSKLGYRMKRG